jgi:2,4-dienoyl-CoA reductase-like NADH-dependent reductase (Old Yellow Enzyme family)
MTDPVSQRLFDTPYTIKGVTFRNRILRSSLGGRMAYYDGTVTPAWRNFEKRFAKEGVGGIISATVAVDDKRLSPLEYPKISDDRFIAPLREAVQAVQRLGCPYIMQIGDPAGHTQTSLLPQAEDGKSASSTFDLFYGYRNHATAMTTAEIGAAVRKFRDAAVRVRQAGCDGVEVTASKGYLIQQFLNPATNRRKDAYGGSEWNRFRLLREIVESVREAVGPDYLFGVRLSAADFNYLPLWTFRLPPVWPLGDWLVGNTTEVTIPYGKELKRLGVDYLHIDSGFGFINPKGSPTQGYPIDGIRIFANATRHLSAKAWLRAAGVNLLPGWLFGIGWTYREAANAAFAGQFRAALSAPGDRPYPVIANGGFQKLDRIEQALGGEPGSATAAPKAPECDLVAMARPLLANPDLVGQFRQGRNEPANPCSFCSLCCTRTAILPLGCYDIRRFKDSAEMTAQDRMEREIIAFSADLSP